MSNVEQRTSVRKTKSHLTDWDDPDTLARNRQPCCSAAIEAQASLTKELAEEREAFDLFKREVSEAVKFDIANYDGLSFPRLSRFIQPEPENSKSSTLKVDPVESLCAALVDEGSFVEIEELRQALAKRGLTITEVVSTDTQGEAK